MIKKLSRPRSKLEERIAYLQQKKNAQADLLFNTTDDTRAKITTYQNLLYLSHIGLGVFKNLTDYHVSPRRRILNVAFTVGSLLLTEYLRRRFSRPEETPEE